MDWKSIVLNKRIKFFFNTELSFLRRQESNYEDWIPHQVRNDKSIEKKFIETKVTAMELQSFNL